MAIISDDLLKEINVKTVASRTEIGVTNSIRRGMPDKTDCVKIATPFSLSRVSSSAKTEKMMDMKTRDNRQARKKPINSFEM